MLSPVTPSPKFEGLGLQGQTITLDDYKGSLVWLCLYRYAACPFCSQRVHYLCRRQDDVLSNGVRIVVVFPSPAKRIQRYATKYNPKFDIISDTEERIFSQFEAQTSWLGELRTAVRLPSVMKAVVAAPNNPLAIDGKIHRMPSEFLIDGMGNVARAFYGEMMDEGMSAEEVIEWAAGQTRTAS